MKTPINSIRATNCAPEPNRMALDSLTIHRFLPASLSNGPGRRAVVWVQSCSLACPGCFNPDTHSQTLGSKITIDALVEQILAHSNQLEGLTISGGEPLQQARPLSKLLKQIRRLSSLSVLLFTGYTWTQIPTIPAGAEVLKYCDVVLAGRFNQSLRVASGLLGSSNKTCHYLTSRYSPVDLESVPHAEVIIEPSGEILLSGINPVLW